MKVALVGSSGYIAGFLLERFARDESIESVLTIDLTDSADAYLDLSKPENFDYQLLNEIDFVVFTAAISGPDKCAMEFDFCWSVNVRGTVYFIQQAVERGCKVLFFSSDAVFGDIPGEIYSEVSETLARTPYGRMKKAVEDTFWDNMFFKAIRLSYVVSARDRFVSYCFNCMKENKIAEVFHPFYRNCIIVSDVVEVVVWFTKNWDKYKPDVLNVAGKELVSRVRIADELNRKFGNQLHYTVIRPDESFFQNRPMITQMESLYISKYGILPDKSFSEKMKDEIGEIRIWE